MQNNNWEYMVEGDKNAFLTIYQDYYSSLFHYGLKPRENYSVEDFITDESFGNYHFNLNKADEIFWKQ
jgi:hypothetical protein